ncbi:MAG TPA: glycosyltransferase family 39 protein [Gaiellaceae bacterium]|nr:glycosyltransferase family 39 protein [Gaiellaceae bacterium]
MWVDRPQGLILVFRAILHLDGGSPGVIRGVAAAAAAATVVATFLVALRVAGRITASACALLMASAGASPFLESFTLAGELVASLPAILSLLAFTSYLRGRRPGWLVVAGLLSGCAVMVKQSGFDAALAAVVFLAWTERRRAVRPALVVLAAGAVPVLVGALAAGDLGRWWFAVVGYRGEGDSIVTGSLVHRLDLLQQSLPAVAKGLGLLALLALAGWRRSPLLVRLWLGAAALGVVGGGNFHPHYYLQLVPPLAVLAGAGVERLLRARLRLAAAVCAAAAAGTVAVTAPLWFAGGGAQARAVWPRDPHLVRDGAVARYIERHTRTGDPVLLVWAAADVYYLADRAPAIPYMWRRNLEAIPGALGDARQALAEGRPALVAQVQSVGSLDRSGKTAAILRRAYRRVATVEGVPVYAPRPRLRPAAEEAPVQLSRAVRRRVSPPRRPPVWAG